jgi:hypothetical protein
MKKIYVSLILTGLLAISVAGAALANNPNPRVILNQGPIYGNLSAQWWQWAFSFPAAEVPFFNSGGAVDISEGQYGNVWFLAGTAFGSGPVERTGEIPAGTSLFLPLTNVMNDYPCPPEFNFEPPPGETLEEFLQRTGNEYLDYFVPDPSTLFAEIDGVSLEDLVAYRATSSLIQFTADPALQWFDPCITGTPQDGVSVGYWLLLPPLPPGTHTLHFGVPSASQDITYVLTVTPGR